MSIKVLNITEEGRGGGPLRRIKDVAHTLSGKGVETLVMFPSNDSEAFKNSLADANVEYIQTSLHRLTKEKKSLVMYCLTFIPELIKIIRIVRKRKVDIVLCNGSWQIKGVLAAKFTGAKSIWIQNDSFQPKAVQLLFKWVSGFSDAFVYVSSRTMDFYQGINSSIKAKPTKVIQSPVDLDKFKPGKGKKILSPNSFNILTVGYVNPNKGFETFIRAIGKINTATDLDIQFYIAGPVFDSQQAYFDKLEEVRKSLKIENLNYLGYRSDILELLQSADLYVCSSDFEASPISIWEAMGVGKPVVSTDVGDVREIIEENKAGLVVPTQDPKALADAILKMIEQESLRKELAEKGRAVAEEIFSIESVSNQYKAFYNEVNKN